MLSAAHQFSVRLHYSFALYPYTNFHLFSFLSIVRGLEDSDVLPWGGCALPCSDEYAPLLVHITAVLCCVWRRKGRPTLLQEAQGNQRQH